MNDLVQQLIEKAENDFVTVKELHNLYLEPTSVAICFHAQLCAEKYITAYLHHQTIDIPASKKLLDILLPCIRYDNSFLTISYETQWLNDYSLELFYPTPTPTVIVDIKEAEGAVKAITSIRTFIRAKLDLPTESTTLESHEKLNQATN